MAERVFHRGVLRVLCRGFELLLGSHLDYLLLVLQLLGFKKRQALLELPYARQLVHVLVEDVQPLPGLLLRRELATAGLVLISQ